MVTESQPTAKDQVYIKLINEILTGVFCSKDILTEKQLTARYNLSKSPVREALVQLTTEKVLVSIPRLGYKILPVTERDIINATQIRLDIEMSSFRRLEPIFTDIMLKRIHILNENWKAATSVADPPGLLERWKHNAIFHTTLATLSGNELAAQMIEKLIRLEFRAYAQMLNIPENRTHFFAASPAEQHFTIERALAQNDFDRAARALQADILTLQNSITEYIHLDSCPL